jgi:hypothetical protein
MILVEILRISRMKYNLTFLFICILITFTTKESLAQLSPGELASVHSKLEGLSNCTACHELGNKVTSVKCLDCHKEIKLMIDLKKGYHSSDDVKGKECFACHSDHHGLNFQIIRFDTLKFNHHLAGFELKGKHAKISCISCHKKEFIKTKISQNSGKTYLGMDTKCLSCHVDFHQQTLSTDCASCHGADSFKPATGFNHQNTKYPLRGKHTDVSCIKCHPKVIKDGREYQRFSGIEFNNCTVCHKDVHDNKFGQDCKKCHSVESFHQISGIKSFDHSRTNFPLKEKHLLLECKACHKASLTAPIKHDLCINCHKDYHKGEFTRKDARSDCKDCHNERGFKESSYTIERHNNSGFKLEYAHAAIACFTCHKKGEEWKFVDVDSKYDRCINCHKDYHKGEFTRKDARSDCKDCHSESRFKESSYTIERHNNSGFKLENAHAATPCFTCHKKGEEWKFVDLDSKCMACHNNIHQNFINEKYMPEGRCDACHNTVNWNKVTFDHKITKFELIGKHASISCRDCHYRNENGNKYIQRFADLKGNCEECHTDVHLKQFTVNGSTDCTSCHGFETWKAEKFNHDSTRFKLEGGHKGVECKKCHLVIKSNSIPFVQFKNTNMLCVSCHH